MFPALDPGILDFCTRLLDLLEDLLVFQVASEGLAQLAGLGVIGVIVQAAYFTGLLRAVGRSCAGRHDISKKGKNEEI